MFFTCKNFMCSNFTWEKRLLQEIVGGCRPPPPFRTALVYYVNVSFDEKL